LDRDRKDLLRSQAFAQYFCIYRYVQKAPVFIETGNATS
jgi:hypothetical protein